MDFEESKRIEKEVDLRKQRSYLVVKDNDLIQKAQFQLTATQQKVICYAISMIKPEDELFSMYEIDIRDYAELCGLSLKNVYRDFKQLVDDLDQKTLWIKTPTKTFKFRWFSEAEYIEGKGKLRVMLNSNIKDYLLNLQRNFTQYELWNILAFKSKWSIRLFELFKSYEYRHSITFSIEELKELLGAENYKQFGDFKKRVLDKATEEINLYSDITIAYDVVRTGREHKATEIKFSIDKKDMLEGHLAYRKTIDKINEKNKKHNIKGQLSFDEFGGIVEDN